MTDYPFTTTEITVSSTLILLAVVPAVWFLITYGLISPWYKIGQHGWLGVVTFLNGISEAALLSLIVYGIWAGHAADEPWRALIAVMILAAMTSKVIVLHVERHNGRKERTSRMLKPNEAPVPISNDVDKTAV